MSKEIHLIDYCKAVWKRKALFCFVVFVITTISLIYAFTVSSVYRVETSIIPVSSSSSSTFSVSSLIPSFMGGSRGGSDNHISLYLQSKALQRRVVKALGWITSSDGDTVLSEERKLDQATVRLAGMIKVKNSMLFQELITISVESSDPNSATRVLKQYLVELQNFISDNALTNAKRYRRFIEEQITQNKEDLLEIGKDLAVFYSKNPISAERAKLNVPVAVYANGEIRNFKGYEEFRKKFNLLQTDDVNNSEQEIRFVKDVPHQIYLQYITTQKQILETNYASLMQSYQMAKLDEAKQEPSFQILEEPVVPQYAVFPQKKKIVIRAFFISLFLALIVSLYIEYPLHQRRLYSVELSKPKSQVR